MIHGRDRNFKSSVPPRIPRRSVNDRHSLINAGLGGSDPPPKGDGEPPAGEPGDGRQGEGTKPGDGDGEGLAQP